MDDSEIIALYFDRDEAAIKKTKEKYGRSLLKIAASITKSEEDAHECENDTYLHIWNEIPPQRPANFRGYLCATARNIALTLVRREKDKRSAQSSLALDELMECIGDSSGDPCDDITLENAIGDFLRAQSKQQRYIFMRRYFFNDSIAEIAKSTNLTENGVKSSLLRSREKLRDHLSKEGINL